MKCKHCNSEIDEDSVFCEQCGAKVVDEIPDDNREEPKSNTKKYLWLGVGVVVIAILLWLVVSTMHLVGVIGLTVFVLLGLVLWYVALFTHSKKQKRLY
ncbi:MAG: zinc-ribbon domain-containing protein [Bacteroidales bacterium]|nr:zinc-ribbon domain-containing protein [Bacteroidales bacterium]